MVEGDEAAIELLISHEEFAKAVEPAMRHFDDPTPGLLRGITLEFAGLLSAAFDVGDVTMPLNGLQREFAGVTRIGAQVLAAPMGRLGTLDHDGIEYRLQLRNVMPIRSGHDE